jgi:hypothetical protein
MSKNISKKNEKKLKTYLEKVTEKKVTKKNDAKPNN